MYSLLEQMVREKSVFLWIPSKKLKGAGTIALLCIYVASHRLCFKAFEAYSKRTWKTEKGFEVQTRVNGFFVIRFECEKGCNKILA